jgi:Cysteine dioxygenase type I
VRSGKACLVDDRQSMPPGLRLIVEDVANSPDIWSPFIRFNLYERHCQRLRRDEDLEVWLICWDLGQDTLLHDHGGSVGAFAVVRGALLEDYGAKHVPALRTRQHATGSVVGFGADYVHNLVNVGLVPTVSIHAYSPPLRVMNFYCWLPTGLHHVRKIACDTPEPAL